MWLRGLTADMIKESGATRPSINRQVVPYSGFGGLRGPHSSLATALSVHLFSVIRIAEDLIVHCPTLLRLAPECKCSTLFRQTLNRRVTSCYQIYVILFLSLKYCACQTQLIRKFRQSTKDEAISYTSSGVADVFVEN